jgi:hypothetical protein
MSKITNLKIELYRLLLSKDVESLTDEEADLMFALSKQSDILEMLRTDIKPAIILVEGDHPVLMRIYKYCTPIEAEKLIKDMVYYGYENVKMGGKEIL